MVYSVRLSVEDSTWESVEGVSVRRTSFLLSLPVGISTAKLFVVYDQPTDDNPSRQVYYTIACAADLVNLTEDAPPVETPSAMYRTDTVDLITDDPQDMERFIADVKRRLESVLREVKQLEALAATTTFDIVVE